MILAAQEAAKLSEKPVRVVPSRSQQAALAALVELAADEDAATNAERLEAALAEIRSGAVAPAARDDAAGALRARRRGGLRRGAVVAWGGAGSTLSATIERVAEDAEIVTVIEGDGAPIPLSQLPLELPDGLELELHHGGQPNYWWLIAAQ